MGKSFAIYIQIDIGWVTSGSYLKRQQIPGLPPCAINCSFSFSKLPKIPLLYATNRININCNEIIRI